MCPRIRVTSRNTFGNLMTEMQNETNENKMGKTPTFQQIQIKIKM